MSLTGFCFSCGHLEQYFDILFRASYFPVCLFFSLLFFFWGGGASQLICILSTVQSPGCLAPLRPVTESSSHHSRWCSQLCSGEFRCSSADSHARRGPPQHPQPPCLFLVFCSQEDSSNVMEYFSLLTALLPRHTSFEMRRIQ